MQYEDYSVNLAETEDEQAELEASSSDAQFQVHLEVFEGPLDLLLKLIERKQLDITRVALAEVAEGFLAYIDKYPEMPPGPLASFVWVASKLLWIKSQTLLPRPPLAPTEDDEDDPGDELIRRLEAYRRVREAAQWLREREARGLRSYVRHVPLVFEQTSEPRDLGTGLDGVTLSRLVRLVQKRMQLGLPAGPAMGTATRGHTVTVAEKVAQLRRRISKLLENERIALGGEFEEAAMRSRTELVVLFLAVLEMIRRKYATAEQDELFGEIWMRKA
jgi:segregation and condensation protein A